LAGKRVVKKQNVSGPVAALVIGLAIVVSIAVFTRASLAPKEPPPFILPREPPMEESERRALQTGLMPLGVAAVLPPLLEDRQSGARVAFLRPDSPAMNAGIRVGDLIRSLNGQPVYHAPGLVSMLQAVDSETSYAIEVVRDGKTLKLTVTGITPLSI
jgi:S1-C subfamily serine protease